MLIQTQAKNNYSQSLVRHVQNNFQWKKASKNLHNFIEKQHFTSIRSYQSPEQYQTSLNRRNIILSTKSIYNNLQKQQNGKIFFSPSSRSNRINENLLLKQRRLGSPNKINQPFKSKIQFVPQQKFINIGIQASEQDYDLKKKAFLNQNRCQKDLIQILQKQILNYSKVISEKDTLINNLNATIQNLRIKLAQQQLNESQIRQKFLKEKDLNICMEYIIAELNEKIKDLMDKNTELQQVLEQNTRKLNESQKATELFIESQSQLSINSENQRKWKLNQISMNCGSINEITEQKNIFQDHQSWSCSALELSRFNKTPSKICQASINQEGQINSATNEFKQDLITDQIIYNHKIEINKLKEQIRYCEIENSMLRRKAQLSEKNNEEVHQLKQRIQKLSERNKISKLIRQSQKKNRFITNENQIKAPLQNQQFIQSPKQKSRSHNQKNDPLKSEKLSQKQNFSIKTCTFDQKSKDQTFSIDSKQNEITIPSKQQYSPKRKNALQRKFVRKQSGSPRSAVKSDDDSEVSLSLSPQRI